MPEEEKSAYKDVKIGELLVAVNVVTSGDLQEAIQIAKRMNLPIGRVIVMSGVISEANLQHVLEAQSLVKDGLLEYDTAVTALRNCLKDGSNLQAALADLRWSPKKDVASNKLGELLMDSNMVTQSQLDSALHASFESGMPLGGTLVLQGVLSAQLLPMVLNAQEQIRDGKIDRMQAVENLKSAVMFWAKADDSKTGGHANYLQDFAESALRASAPAALRAAPEMTLAEPPPAAVPSVDMGLVDMMKMAGYCSEQELQAAIARALANADIASKLLMATGLLTQASFENFLRCRALMVRGAIRPEQVIYALSACRIRQISLDAVFREMGLNIT